MVIDGSAALAILLGESGDETFADAIDADPTRLMSAVSVQETAIVVEARKGPAGDRELDLLLHRGRIDVVAVNANQLELARNAYRRYGKGSHPQRSNSATAAPMLLRPQRVSLCPSEAATSLRQTSRRHSLEHRADSDRLKQARRAYSAR